jgi:23S rRNA (adenine2503-C2)-methyltransferase
MVRSLFALTPDRIAEELGLSKAFQARQIYSWLCRGVTEPSKMTDLPLVLRNELEKTTIISSTVIHVQKDDDGACKLALKLHDSNIVECVLLTDKEGELTACLSSQVGCAMGCAFCRTGTLKLTRNLESFEIVEQFIHLQNKAPDKISHVVFMGMGEPMANLDAVLEAISFLHDPKGINISHRRITISTCGVASGIDKLSASGVPVRLAVSLVCAVNSKRSALMPVNRTFPLERLRESLVKFQNANSRRFTFEYCMIPGENMDSSDARALEQFCRNLEVIVNLIPFNPCPELPFRSPTKQEIKQFTSELDSLHVPYTIRISRGRSIKGACGQLAAKYQ